MSRFSSLKKHLSFGEAIAFYFKMKTGRWNDFRLKKLRHPFVLRNNPYDFATFDEVLLREEYNIQPGFEPKTIIDGGANIGLTAVYFASRFPNAEILSVEPDKDNFKMLVENARHYPNIIPVNCGIWNRKINLTIIDKWEGNNAFTVEETTKEIPGSIPAVTVGDLRRQQQWNTIDILKLDIEGSEKNVFESNYEDWLRHVKILIIELHDRIKHGCSDTVFEALSQYNFSKEIKGENHIFCNRDLL
jgi:FkbM family methyltransferase